VPHTDLFGCRGRAWLAAQALPPDEQDAVARHLREYDRLGEDLRVVERELARDALADPDAKRLMTIPGISIRGAGRIGGRDRHRRTFRELR
jgi:transposase